ncbi:MAG: DUF1819 family protein [Desulfosalsimonadaceae bacterium]
MAPHSTQGQKKTYDGGIVAGSLLVPESREVARLLLQGKDKNAWKDAIMKGNILQKRSPETAKRQGRLIQKRLSLMNPEHWELVSEGHAALATQAVMAAAIKHSHLIGDFMQSVVREHWRTFQKTISDSDWHHFMENCAQLDPRVDTWTDKTRAKLKQVVFRILAEAGYIQSTKSRQLQPVSIEPALRKYLDAHSEAYVLRCMSATE